MLDMDFILKQARTMIGTQMLYEGQNCTVIEILEDRLQWILEAEHPSSSIQTDAYGNARREMRALYYLPLYNEAGEPHPRLLALMSLDKTHEPDEDI